MTRGVTASLRTVASSERVHSRESDSGVSSDSSLIIARFRSVGSDTPATCSRHAIARARARRGLVGSGSGSARALARRTGARARLCASIPEASFRGVSPRPLPRGVRATASYSAASGSASDASTSTREATERSVCQRLAGRARPHTRGRGGNDASASSVQARSRLALAAEACFLEKYGRRRAWRPRGGCPGRADEGCWLSALRGLFWAVSCSAASRDVRAPDGGVPCRDMPLARNAMRDARPPRGDALSAQRGLARVCAAADARRVRVAYFFPSARAVPQMMSRDIPHPCTRPVRARKIPQRPTHAHA